MADTKTSIDAYNDLEDATSSQKSVLALEDLKRLLGLMKEELLVSGGSPLIAAAYRVCCPPLRKTYSPNCFSLSVSTIAKKADIPHYDAWWLIILLSQYLASGAIAEASEQHLAFFFRGVKYKQATTDDLDKALEVIDAEISTHRRKMFNAFSTDKPAKDVGKDEDNVDSAKTAEQKSTLDESRKETDNRAGQALQAALTKKGEEASSVINRAKEQARQILESAKAQAEKQAQQYLDAAWKKVDAQAQKYMEDTQNKVDEQARLALERAEERARQIEQDANQRAQRTIGRAAKEAEKKMSETRNRFADLVKDSKSQAVDKEAEDVQKHFRDIRTAMQEANEKIRKLEDAVSEITTKKVSAQLLELFNLIADAKDSAFDLARKNNDNDLENAAYNMDAFLDMIIEYMADYGIQPIATAPNSRFSGKYHTPVNAEAQFDPRTAIVKVSKRSGFLWGDQVLQKEQVEI